MVPIPGRAPLLGVGRAPAWPAAGSPSNSIAPSSGSPADTSSTTSATSYTGSSSSSSNSGRSAAFREGWTPAGTDLADSSVMKNRTNVSPTLNTPWSISLTASIGLPCTSVPLREPRSWRMYSPL